ncbi:hypothetical protein BGZ46_005327, partial [Entomortierella lignicola]
MGILGLWAWMKEKNVSPTSELGTSHCPTCASFQDSSNTIHLDLLGAFFSVVQQAYSNCSLDDANAILESAISKIGTKNNLIVYIDGSQCQEKLATQELRRKNRDKACQDVRNALDIFHERTASGQRIRKRHFANIRKPLKACYQWTLEEKLACSKYLRSQGWCVVDCPTEADVAIAKAIKEGDVVVSRDGDFFAYQQVRTIWRVVGFGSRQTLQCYHLDDIMTYLNLTRHQLTALCTVSSNDYNRNIKTLGICTNYDLIKEIEEAVAGQDVTAIVDCYLKHDNVIWKNTKAETFAKSLGVFVGLVQIPISSPTQHEHLNQYRLLRAEFNDACLALKNRPTCKRPKSGNHHTSELTPHRSRYSFKVRQEAKKHERPQVIRQYKWKEWKTSSPIQIPDDTVQKDAQALSKHEARTTRRKTAILDTASTKKQILTALEYEHPLTTLRLGLLDDSVQKALSGQQEVSQEVV